MRTERQETFVKEFVLTGNATQSAIKAGYSAKTAHQKGHQLKKQFIREIEDATREAMQDAVPGALAQIKELSASADSESVRLQAAKDILDRAGLNATQKIEQVTIEKSTDELRRELEQLMAGEKEPEVEDIPATLN
jgi:phage terminase small subunit